MYSLLVSLLGQLFKVLGIFTVLMFVGFAYVLLSEVPSYLSSKVESHRLEEDALKEVISSASGSLEKVRSELHKKKAEIDEAYQKLDDLNRKREWWAHRLTNTSMKEYHEKKARIHAERKEREEELQALEEKWSRAVALIPGTRENREKLAEVTEKRERAEEQADNVEELTSSVKDRIRETFPEVLKFVLWALAAIFLVPLLWKIVMYFGVAKVLEKGKPIVLERDPAHVASELKWSDSNPAQSFHLEPGENLLIKTEYLQSSEESLTKASRILWSWRYPFSSLAAKLSLLTRFSNETSDARSVTLSDMEDGVCELAHVEIPQGASLVVRPSFLVGALFSGEQPKIETRWRIFSLHAWITFQFRYFIFSDPCVLIFSAGRGLQPEYLDDELRDGELVGKRINEGMMIAFTPNLSYGSRRAETAIAGYIFKGSSLFDDYFEGSGSFAAQQVLSGRQREDGKKEHFLERIFGALGKLIGL